MEQAPSADGERQVKLTSGHKQEELLSVWFYIYLIATCPKICTHSPLVHTQTTYFYKTAGCPVGAEVMILPCVCLSFDSTAVSAETGTALALSYRGGWVALCLQMGYLIIANVNVREAQGCCRNDKQAFSESPRFCAVKDLLHFNVDLPPCVDRTELLSATDSKHPFLPPRLAFWGAEGCFAMRKCSTGHFSAIFSMTNLCVRLVGSGSDCPRLHVSKSSRALLSLSSDTKPLAPVSTNQAQH